MNPQSINRDNPTLAPQTWDNGKFSVQSWLKAVPGRRLKDTAYGMSPENEAPHPAVFEDPLLQSVIKMDIATFLIAERHSVRNTARMIPLAPDENAEIFLATQVMDEARHFEVFSRRMADLGVSPEQREKLMTQYTTPAMAKLFDLIDEQIDKKDFIGSAIGQNLILEGMAFPVYRYESRYWSRMDPGLSEIIRGAFADEVQHTGFGENFLRTYVERNPADRDRVGTLVRKFRGLMNEVFTTVIFHYIGLYQAAADEHMDFLGDIVIFPGHKMADTSEEEQVRLLMAEVDEEFLRRAGAIGVDAG